MADVTLLPLTVGNFTPDLDAQLVAGDGGATYVWHESSPEWSFDTTDEEAIISYPFIMPTQYAAGTLKLKVQGYFASATSSNARVDAFVEAVTPADAIDLEAASGWDTTANSVSIAAAATAGYLVEGTITLTNKDSVAAGDRVRIGVRRDTDHADDAAAGDFFLTACELLETQ